MGSNRGISSKGPNRAFLRPRSILTTSERTFNHYRPRERIGSDPGSPPLRTRFRHGDSWRSGRVRSLSAATIAISTGSPPRQGETVEIELAVAEMEISVMATVVAVTPPEAAELLGAFGFGARFIEQDAYVRHRLRQLLRHAEEQGAFAELPPPRRHPRYPVRWPVVGNIDEEDLRFTALDISERGMFLVSTDELSRGSEPRLTGAPAGRSTPPIGAIISITMPAEVGGPSLRALAHVTRVLDKANATAHDLPPGFGLEIISMEHPVASAFSQLVARVKCRAGRRVLIVAEARRLARANNALGSIGYVVHGISSPAGLLHKGSLHQLAPDLVMVDTTAEATLLEMIESELRYRRTPVVTIDQMNGPAIRYAADSFLLA